MGGLCGVSKQAKEELRRSNVARQEPTTNRRTIPEFAQNTRRNTNAIHKELSFEDMEEFKCTVSLI